MASPKIIGLAETVKPRIIGLADESQEPEEEQFLQPKQESFLDKLPRNIAIGLAKLGHRTTNLPYQTAKDIQNLSEPFGKFQRQHLPALQGKQKQESYLEKMVNQFNQEHNVPEELKNKNWGFNVENIPHQQEQNYPEMLGQQGRGTLIDRLIQGGLEYAPDIAALGSLAKSGAKALFPNIGEKISDIRNYKKLQEQLSTMENRAKLASESANEADLLIQEAENEAKAIKEPEEISKFLNKGAAHEVRGAKAIQHRLNNIENYWKSGYKDLKNELKNSEFHMENMPEYENGMNDILEEMGVSFEEGVQPEISSELKSIINKAPTPKDIKADDFLTKYQDFRDARYDLLQRAKEAKTAGERKELFQAYEDSKPIEQMVSDALNEGLGPHKAEFQRINKGYSEQIYPLRSNKVARKALAGKLGPNTIEDLAGTGEGQELMREIVKQDPELLRNIIGQRYAAKPSKLHELDENVAEYLSESPELKNMLDENIKSIEEKLSQVNKHKQSKNISLKQKLDAENEAKQLRDKIRIINKDKIKIRKVGKKIKNAGKYGLIFYGGSKALNSLFK